MVSQPPFKNTTEPVAGQVVCASSRSGPRHLGSRSPTDSYNIPSFWSLWGDWWTLRKPSQAIKKWRKLLVSLPCLFALWITSYICLSISANRGVPSICQYWQSRILICLMGNGKDIVFDLSVFIYKSLLINFQPFASLREFFSSVISVLRALTNLAIS